MSKFLTLVVSGAASGAIYSLVASGLVLSYAATGIFNLSYGAVAYTSAPCTGPPQVEVTWKRRMSVAVLRWTTRGSLTTASSRSFTGGARLETRSGLPPDGQPFPRDDAAARRTTAVGSEIAVALPSEFEATTRKRSVEPTSTELRTYVAEETPSIVAQLPPIRSQRSQE